MTDLRGFFDGLKQKLFGKTESSKASEPVKRRARPTFPRLARSRDPYFVQIGFDFGTAFSKCVCRDVLTDKAWVYQSKTAFDKERPFLLPTTLTFCEGRLSRPSAQLSQYADNSLPHIKMALQKVALESWDDPVLEPYIHAIESNDRQELSQFVCACAVYVIGSYLGDVRQHIRKRVRGFGGHEEDYWAVNLAVPAADAEIPRVAHLFRQVLEVAWALSDDLVGSPARDWVTLPLALCDVSNDTSSIQEACFLYPEVSANVQGFVRSRTSAEGMYLFSDTGAGTVDQSVFIFVRRNGNDHLTYLHANVVPCGSSNLERLAVEYECDDRKEALETWRLRK